MAACWKRTIAASLATLLIGFIGLAVVCRPAASVTPPAKSVEAADVASPGYSGELAWAVNNGRTDYSEVEGAWTQPAVVPSTTTEYADTWVGITDYDGYLLQTGTQAASSAGHTYYTPWFLAWTGKSTAMVVIDHTVLPGDHMAAAIVRKPGAHVWSVTLSDSTQNWTWSTTVTYPAKGATAEWIEEAPSTWTTLTQHQSLANYGAVEFSTVQAGGSAPEYATAFEIVSNGNVISSPAYYNPKSGTFEVRFGPPRLPVQVIGLVRERTP